MTETIENAKLQDGLLKLKPDTCSALKPALSFNSARALVVRKCPDIATSNFPSPYRGLLKSAYLKAFADDLDSGFNAWPQARRIQRCLLAVARHHADERWFLQRLFAS